MPADQPPSLPTLLTKADVCRELRVNERTVERWIACGLWPAPDVSIGAKFRRWTREEFLAGVAALANQEATAK